MKNNALLTEQIRKGRQKILERSRVCLESSETALQIWQRKALLAKSDMAGSHQRSSGRSFHTSKQSWPLLLSTLQQIGRSRGSSSHYTKREAMILIPYFRLMVHPFLGLQRGPIHPPEVARPPGQGAGALAPNAVPGIKQ